MRCRIELLSPLHIGNGNELKLVDFYLDDEKNLIKRIDFSKFTNHCFENEINLMEEIGKKRYLTGRDFSITKFMDENSIDPDAFSSYTIKAIIEKRERETEFAVKEHIKHGSAYIPGSSIKGAIRTAIMWSFLNESGNVGILFGELDKLLKGSRTPDFKHVDDELSKRVFGRDAHRDIFRALRITDTHPMDLSNLEVSQVRIVGNPQDIPVYVENLKTGTNASFDLYLDEDLLNTKSEVNFRAHKLREYMSVVKLCKACNVFSRYVVEGHLGYFWEKYDCANTVSFLEKLRDDIIACGSNEAIIHIGWGGGWYSTTIGLLVMNHPAFTSAVNKNMKCWSPEKYTLRYKLQLGKKPGTRNFSKQFPKTRRVTVKGEPLGWVKITMV